MTKGYWGNGSAFPWAERTSLWGSANTVVACFTGMIDFLHRYSCEVNSRYVLDTVGIFLCVGVFFFCLFWGLCLSFLVFFLVLLWFFLCFVCLFFNFLFFFYFTFSFYSGCHGGRKKPELKSSAVVFYWELNWRLTPSAHRINSLATAC